mmetsp:Transcript_64493/g.148353  ORF Transcript_64493/g.148353 Transcript_64493/m.148353 type:complete len:80 (-) Transcript_64493:202-441(-)
MPRKAANGRPPRFCGLPRAGWSRAVPRPAEATGPQEETTLRSGGVEECQLYFGSHGRGPVPGCECSTGLEVHVADGLRV